VAVRLDQVIEAQLASESVRPTERRRSEPGQVIDMLGPALGEQGLQQRIGEDLRVEQLLEAVQCLLSAGVIVETRHSLTRRAVCQITRTGDQLGRAASWI